MSSEADSLWRNPRFIRLWVAQILSQSGSQITQVALPLTAVLVLEATASQMAMLVIARSLPNLMFGLFAGVWVDRTRRGPILLGADIGRAIVLGNLLWSLGVLLIPFAGWVTDVAFWVVCVGQVFAGLGASIFSVNQMGLRQQLTPVDRFGRTTAARRFLIFGLAAVGASVAGFLGHWIGLQATLFLGGVGFFCGFWVVFFSPVRRIEKEK